MNSQRTTWSYPLPCFASSFDRHGLPHRSHRSQRRIRIGCYAVLVRGRPVALSLALAFPLSLRIIHAVANDRIADLLDQGSVRMVHLGERAGEMNGALTVFRIIHVQLRHSSLRLAHPGAPC